MQWDVFITHVHEDAASAAHPLAEALRRHGLAVLLDGQSLAPGTGVRRAVDEGLARAGWGVLVIGPGFLAHDWPRGELDRLLAREMGGERLVLPVWHGVTGADVAHRSPMLAARLAIESDAGIDALCEAVLAAAGRPGEPAAEPQRTALPAIWRSMVENPGFSLTEVHQHLAQRESYAEQAIGGFVLRELVGVGGSGAVFRAMHGALGRQVALKLFFPFADDLRLVAQATERAVRGISSLRHSGIAALVDYGYVRFGIGAAPYLAYDWLDGRPLLAWTRGLAGDPAEALARRLGVAIGAAQALEAAHAADVLHGDLKPSNVLVRADDGQPVLLDFMMPGIQRLAAERLELWNGWEKDMEGRYQFHVPVHAVSGAPGYVAPELEAGGAVTLASDVYALGRIFADLFWLGAADPPGGDADVAELVARMTAARPEDRPASAGDVAVRLQRIRAGHQARARSSALA
jgi:hypothetical protein